MMMNSTQEFFNDNPWSNIDHPCYPDGRRLFLKDERFWVSMDESRQILFFVQDRGGDQIKPLENIAGLNVTIESYGRGESRLVCRLTSQDPDLLDKFATVAKDIAFHCSAFKGHQLFLKTQERIKSWANFLKPSRTGLTRSEFVGLFGELYVLSEHLMPALPVADAIKAWGGPDGKKQDFVLGDSAIEVKTTLSGEQQTIRISSLDQLDKETDRLFLARIVAAPAQDGSGLSLGALYSKCLNEVGHDVAAESNFLQKVSPLYGKASESQIKDNFHILNVSLFEVNDRFPKLSRSDVDPTIRDAKYDINVSGLADFEVTLEIGEVLSHG
jgi:hypothetical protein